MAGAGDALSALFGLQDKFVLVTGSTQGIGKATAKAFVAAGAKVIVNGRRQDTVDSTVAELNSAGLAGSAVGVVGDLSTAEGIASLARQVDDIGALAVLVSNVGIFEVKDFFAIPDAEWQRYFDVNVMSTVRICRHFLGPMLQRGAGRIIIVSSECGVRGLHTMAHYAMTKAAQINLSRSLAELTRSTNVTVNAVLPGPTLTEGVVEYLRGVAEARSVTREQAQADYFKENEPTSLLQRFLTPEEVANTILFLGSQAASGINGSAQRVEGGIIATAA
ncbi:putative oxidoreductase [Tribonema minus]|uniref:3-oxoacyl-[acyl-carrier-protein] reductase n=1 Tax=Tribonema minus TaxID=303371 RepID=A0A835Z0B4_9STRA|nr:putative oxidoreductase [Tribonema minus]